MGTSLELLFKSRERENKRKIIMRMNEKEKDGGQRKLMSFLQIITLDVKFMYMLVSICMHSSYVLSFFMVNLGIFIFKFFFFID